jgi:hypothetical protein
MSSGLPLRPQGSYGCGSKRLQLFHEMVPRATRLGHLIWRENRDTWEALGRPRDEVARKRGVSLIGPPLDFPINEAAYRRVFVRLTQDHADGLMVGDEEDNYTNHKVIVDLAKKNRLPAIYPAGWPDPRRWPLRSRQ